MLSVEKNSSVTEEILDRPKSHADNTHAELNVNNNRFVKLTQRQNR